MKTYKCVLCGDKFEGYGNNAEPLKKGLCCDECNLEVIRERIKRLKNLKREKSINV